MIPLKLALENILVHPVDIPFYWAYAVNSYYEVEGLKNLGVSDILVGPPLCFDLKALRKQFNGTIRMVPNVCLTIAET